AASTVENASHAPAARDLPRAIRAAAISPWFTAALVLGVLVWIVGAALPGSWLWGANVLRFLPRAAAIGLVGLMLAGLPLILTLHAHPAAERLRLAPPLLGVGLALGLALLCGRLPDRVRFTGDFMYREGAVAGQTDAARVMPQAMPLDVWLHFRLPAQLRGAD